MFICEHEGTNELLSTSRRSIKNNHAPRNYSYCKRSSVDKVTRKFDFPDISHYLCLIFFKIWIIIIVDIVFFYFSYMESIIVNTVSSNANKGRSAIDWVVDAIGKESKVYMSWVEILRSLLSVKIILTPYLEIKFLS